MKNKFFDDLFRRSRTKASGAMVPTRYAPPSNTYDELDDVSRMGFPEIAPDKNIPIPAAYGQGHVSYPPQTPPPPRTMKEISNPQTVTEWDFRPSQHIVDVSEDDLHSVNMRYDPEYALENKHIPVRIDLDPEVQQKVFLEKRVKTEAPVVNNSRSNIATKKDALPPIKPALHQVPAGVGVAKQGGFPPIKPLLRQVPAGGAVLTPGEPPIKPVLRQVPAGGAVLKPGAPPIKPVLRQIPAGGAVLKPGAPPIKPALRATPSAKVALGNTSQPFKIWHAVPPKATLEPKKVTFLEVDKIKEAMKPAVDFNWETTSWYKYKNPDSVNKVTNAFSRAHGNMVDTNVVGVSGMPKSLGVAKTADTLRLADSAKSQGMPKIKMPL